MQKQMGYFKSAVLYVAGLVLSASFPLNMCAQETQQTATPPKVSAHAVPGPSDKSASASITANDQSLPDSPGAEMAGAQSSPAQPGTSTQAQQRQSPASPTDNQKLNRPVGTAAAEAPRVTGITAAEPAGIAIAPAKQKRVRTIVFKVGAIVGASVALGTVIALTAGTSSKPPGAH